jgi:hypothetical protein
MTQKRKVGPGGGDFALNPNRFSGGGGGKSIVTGKKSSVSKKSKEKLKGKKKEAPEKPKTSKKLDDLVKRMSRLYGAKEKSEREGKIAAQKKKVQDAKDKKENEKIWLKKLEKSLLKDSAWDRRN